jgi:Transposase zinc-ribbon domain
VTSTKTDVDTSNVVIGTSQHFLLSRAAKTLTLAQVFRMTDAEAETTFRNLRWPETDGKPVCSECGGLDAYAFRRGTGALRFECRACKNEFRHHVRHSIRLDGGYFGGYVKPANKQEDRRDRRFAENQSGKRKVVVVIRERGGNTLPGVFASD